MESDEREGITPSDTDNKLGLIDPAAINQKEAQGVVDAYSYAFSGEVDLDEMFAPGAVLQLHRIAFFELYHWGGVYRRTTPSLRQLKLPPPSDVPNLMVQLLANTDYRRQLELTPSENVELLAGFHRDFLAIHPFENGNGRMARLLTDILAAQLGYQNISLYAPQGNRREQYLAALAAADQGDYGPLEAMITAVLKPL